MSDGAFPSDVLPVLAIGGHAVHIPYHVTWFHETASDDDLEGKTYHELESTRHLPSLLHDFGL